MLYESLERALLGILMALESQGKTNSSRGFEYKELLFHNIVINDPTAIVISNPKRKFNERYSIAEFLWYLSADRSVVNISKLAQMWAKIADSQFEVESNYGEYILPQWEWVINELKNDMGSRRAVITINQPYHKDKNPKDVPCTQYLQFFIRDGYLSLGVQMRSNDVIYGFCNDVYNFCLFQQAMLNELKQTYPDLKLGKYYHMAGSMHLYDTSFNMSKEIIDYYLYTEDDGTIKHRVLDPNFSILNNTKMKLPSRNMSKEELNEYVDLAAIKLFP